MATTPVRAARSIAFRARIGRQIGRTRRSNLRLRRQGVRLGDGAMVAPGSNIDPDTTIGPHTAIAGPCQITGAGRATIGAYCAIAGEMLLITGNHNTDHPNVLAGLHARHGWPSALEPADVTIGSACWIGARVTILPGVTIGDGAVIGACSLVRQDVPPFSIVAGVPAEPKKSRCSAEVAAAMQEIAWWTWPEDRIARNRQFFETDLSAVTADELRSAVR